MISKSAMTQKQAITSAGQLPRSDLFNATVLCQDSKKKINDYLRLAKTKALLTTLSKELGLSVSDLAVIRQGGISSDQGTLLHVQLKRNFMEWLAAPPVASEEKAVQARLHKELGGHREVPHSVGFIDILTELEVIEVKEVRCWMKGVGQLMIYGQDYPRHQKRLHLFGVASPSKRGIIKSYCTPLAIETTWEDN